mmetsp:Transcript_21206/g.60617  ORF Transcript_21206/g.60617 Transcript_21206/m.60617 type:complete len:266 (+) Transcript_21206:216-1013(+)
MVGPSSQRRPATPLPGDGSQGVSPEDRAELVHLLLRLLLLLEFHERPLQGGVLLLVQLRLHHAAERRARVDVDAGLDEVHRLQHLLHPHDGRFDLGRHLRGEGQGREAEARLERFGSLCGVLGAHGRRGLPLETAAKSGRVWRGRRDQGSPRGGVAVEALPPGVDGLALAQQRPAAQAAGPAPGRHPADLLCDELPLPCLCGLLHGLDGTPRALRRALGLAHGGADVLRTLQRRPHRLDELRGRLGERGAVRGEGHKQVFNSFDG